MYSLFGCMFGNNNLPDDTITVDDFEKTGSIFFRAPRVLHELQNCAKCGAPIMVFDPLGVLDHERFTKRHRCHVHQEHLQAFVMDCTV